MAFLQSNTLNIDQKSRVFITDIDKYHSKDNIYNIILYKLNRKDSILIRDYQIQNRSQYIKRIISAKKSIVAIGQSGNLSFNGGRVFHYHKNFIGYHAKLSVIKQISNFKIKKYLQTTSCHTLKEILLAIKLNIKNAFLSPIFKTKHYTQKQTIGLIKFYRMQKLFKAKINLIPLGGMGVNQVERSSDVCQNYRIDKHNIKLQHVKNLKINKAHQRRHKIKHYAFTQH